MNFYKVLIMTALGCTLFLGSCQDDPDKGFSQRGIVTVNLNQPFDYGAMKGLINARKSLVFENGWSKDTIAALSVSPNFHLPDGEVYQTGDKKAMLFISAERMSVFFPDGAQAKTLAWFSTEALSNRYYESNKKNVAESTAKMLPIISKIQRLYHKDTYYVQERKVDYNKFSPAEINEFNIYQKTVKQGEGCGHGKAADKGGNLRTTAVSDEVFLPQPATAPVWWIHITRQSSSTDPWGPYAAIIKGMKILTDHFSVYGTWSDIKDFTVSYGTENDMRHVLHDYKTYIVGNGAGLHYLGPKVINLYIPDWWWGFSSWNGMAYNGKGQDEGNGHYVCVSRKGKDEPYAHEAFHTLGAQHDSGLRLRGLLVPMFWLPIFWTDIMYTRDSGTWDYFMFSPTWELWNRDNRARIQNNLYRDNPI